MIQHKNAVPNYHHYIPLEAIPDGQMQLLVHTVACRDDYQVYDYRDGDYYYLIDFNEIPYPIRTDGDKKQLEMWNLLIDFLKLELDPEVVKQNSLAIYCSQ